MPATYEPIASVTLGTAASTVTFSSIPGTYTDLILMLSGSLTSGTSVWGLQYNSDTAANYSWTSLRGDGSSATSARDSGSTRILCGWIGTSQVTEIVHIMNYSNATTNKTNISRNNSTVASTYVSANVGLWRNSTVAINAITARTDSSTFATGSIFTIYGIKAA
jgi:hypothetical protein